MSIINKINKMKIVPFTVMTTILMTLISISPMFFTSCDKKCYKCEVQHQFYTVDSITGERRWDIKNIDSTFEMCGYDADAYSGQINDINPGIERTYTKCTGE